MATDQYSVLGKAPRSDELKKLSQDDVYLTIKKLSAGYGKMEILHDFNLFVSEAQSLCLIGPNGAGKSTILHSIYGFTNIFSGQIEIEGKEITKLTPAQKLKSVGIAYILQDNSVFPDMTVEENLEMGAYLRDENFQDTLNEIYRLFPILKKKRNQFAGQLSGGQRQQVALGRALMIKPSVLMLDEPTAGVSPIVMDELFNHIIKVRETGVAILMVEQNARQALTIADRGYVLVTGENKFSGSGKELLNDPEVRRSFLGG